MATQDGSELLARIAAETQVCTRCDLCIGAHQAVPGSGDAQAEVMLIGEAPSYFDDRRGVPFSGPSGTFLDELLGLAGLRREQVFLTNMVKHRVPEGQTLQTGEMTACAEYLTRQIAALDPKVIVTLGRYSLARFLPRAKITAIHGQARLHEGRILVAIMYPAAALHREGAAADGGGRFHSGASGGAGGGASVGGGGEVGRVRIQRMRDRAPQQMSLF